MYGVVVCDKGEKKACVFPEGFNNKPTDKVLKCVADHENVHVNDPAITCDKSRCDPYFPPPPAGQSEEDRECPAYKAAYDCLTSNTFGSEDLASWRELMKLSNEWKSKCGDKWK